jgi:endonuclease YncB( thermonuclease family)
MSWPKGVVFSQSRYRKFSGVCSCEANLAMIEAGLAEVYRGPESGNPYTSPYQAAEEAARAARKGMWGQGDRYESPRAYRKRVGIS